MLTSYFPKLLVEIERPEFEYRKLDEDNKEEVKIFEEDELRPQNGLDVIEDLLRRRKFRIEVADRHTLGRVISLITAICKSLRETNIQDDDAQRSSV